MQTYLEHGRGVRALGSLVHDPNGAFEAGRFSVRIPSEKRQRSCRDLGFSRFAVTA